MKLPQVSICIPTYRQVDYLRETLRSVKIQDFEDYELIISDDTPDSSVEQLVASFDFDERLRYFHNHVSLGSPENWNEAVRHAKGKYIKLLHHDDRFTCSSSLGAFVCLLEENPECDFAFSASSAENLTQGHRHDHCPSTEQVVQLTATPEKLFFNNIIGAPSATIYRNGLGIEYDSALKWLVDVDFYIHILRKNSYIAHTPKILIATAADASHQITEQCKYNATLELSEHIYLYQKYSPQIPDDPDVQYVWFRLFEKYKIYSQMDLKMYGAELFSLGKVLLPFFEVYRQKRLIRTPQRIYATLPEFLKRAIRFLYKNSLNWK